MSKNHFKSQASSSRAASGPGFGGFRSTSNTTLSYLTEPPNLSFISDANVVVEFKNLSKKDATTKTKALEELKDYIREHPYENEGGVEEPIIEAWVKFYPRLSIDNSRRVRELSHNVQYELLKSARKRMEKHLLKIIGSWLAGMYDRDRVVAKAAKDSVVSFLDTQAKLLLLWKRCQTQILGYAQEAVDETPESLSDERTMSADDVQAKYFRVIGSALSLVVNLLVTLGQDDISSHQDKYDYFLSGKEMWSFASCDDAFVRRTTSQLLVVCLDKQPQVIENNLEAISHSFIAEALRVLQSTSALQLLHALNKLTLQFPHTWTVAYSNKKAPITRLRSFAAKGSQGGPPEYWRSLYSLLQILPKSILPAEVDTSLDFLKSYLVGVTNREEPRNNATEAWLSYVETANLLAASLPGQPQIARLFEDSLYPIFGNFLHPTPESSKWSVGNSSVVLNRAYLACSSADDTALRSSFSAEWQRLGDDLIGRMRTSLPEQSKDYAISQDAVTDEGSRWFLLLAEILKTQKGAAEALLLPSSKIVDATIAALISRNGKPYSAAAILDTALRVTPQLLELHPASTGTIQSFIEAHLPKLISSPSSRYLVSALAQFGRLKDKKKLFERAWKSSMDSLLKAGEDGTTFPIITNLVSIDGVSSLCQADWRLQNLFLEASSKAIEGQDGARQLFEAAIGCGIMTSSIEKRAVDEILKRIDADDMSIGGALKAAEFISKTKPQLLESEENVRVTFLAKMLSLAEVPDAHHASHSAALRFIEDSQRISSSSSDGKQAPIIHIIQEGLRYATPKSLSIDTLTLQAKAILETAKNEIRIDTLLPKATEWAQSLQPFLSLPPDTSLAVMRPFAGAVFLVSAENLEHASLPSKDADSYSIPLRMSIYVAALVAEKKFLEFNNSKLLTDLLYWLCITAELLSDEIDILGGRGLFDTRSKLALTQVRAFLEHYQSCLKSIIKRAQGWRGTPRSNQPDDKSQIVGDLISQLLEGSKISNDEGFYAAKALYRLLMDLVAVHGWASVGSDEWISQQAISARGTFGSLAVIAALQDNLSTTKTVSNQCNRLISDLAIASSESATTLGLLVQLNAYLAVYDEADLPVAQTRLVFGVQRMLAWTDSLAATNPQLSSEICRALQKLLPRMREVYGSYWAASVSFCISIWNTGKDELSSDRLPMVGMSLKLFTILLNLKEDNEDLAEALVDNQEAVFPGLVNVLSLRRLEETVPLLFVDDLLLRLIVKTSASQLGDMTEFYPLVASDFRRIQESAYEVLHRALPEAQNEISVNALLDKRDARLPEEVLSLLLDPPSINDFSDEALAEFPSQIRGYLFSWHLVYDSYLNASSKVRNDYSNILQSENYIEPLLTFLFDVLGHSVAVPLNLEKAGFDSSMIRSYDMLEATNTQTNERNMQWLLINIYYLCLTYTPNLVKSWWMECKSKQTQLAVESWTEKYFSPLILDDTIDEVMKWAENQESTSDEEKTLIIKTSRPSREVFAGYEVDDMMIQIVIRLSLNYPLEGVKVEGISRVAVTDKKWNNWLRITEGVIKFSNGSIIDGLSIFRKNVIGALKGGTECAICYSIISADKKMPDKRCQTCKNLFHSSCLFKWFTSSSQSTCPLCRNLFSFGPSAGRAKRGDAER